MLNSLLFKIIQPSEYLDFKFTLNSRSLIKKGLKFVQENVKKKR